MIKFFRKIRQNLLSEGKTGKYLKYAIGEIVLVVIGILIALQINTWNENTQKKEQEIAYYCKIKEDLQNDQKNIQRSIESLDDRIFSAKNLLANLYKQIDDKSILINDYIPAIRSYHFIPSKAAIEDITSSGKLEILNKPQLKTTILQHYSDLEYAMNVLKQNQQDFSKLSYKYDDKIGLGYHQIPLYKDYFGEELLKVMPNTNWQKDKENIIFKQFQDHISMSIIIGAREKELLKQINSSTEKLKLELEQYCFNSN
tara:strand:+ start:1076 stop:1846 length:771 start_codon:yes stop_codon:yes gene_type:complete